MKNIPILQVIEIFGLSVWRQQAPLTLENDTFSRATSPAEKRVLPEGISLHRYGMSFEPTIPDSKSGVLTTTLWELHVPLTAFCR